MAEWKKKRDIMRRYDVTAQIYDERYAQEQRAKIEVALGHVNVEDQDVLDVGCGTGLSFDYVVNKSRITVGLDVSRKTLLKAKERTKKHPNAHLILADADNMPMRDKTFTVIFAITVLQNMPNYANTLGEVKRVAQGDAIIIITGLKKIFSRIKLQHLLKAAGLQALTFRNENLNCHVAVCHITRNA